MNERAKAMLAQLEAERAKLKERFDHNTGAIVALKQLMHPPEPSFDPLYEGENEKAARMAYNRVTDPEWRDAKVQEAAWRDAKDHGEQ